MYRFDLRSNSLCVEECILSQDEQLKYIYIMKLKAIRRVYYSWHSQTISKIALNHFLTKSLYKDKNLPQGQRYYNPIKKRCIIILFNKTAELLSDTNE